MSKYTIYTSTTENLLLLLFSAENGSSVLLRTDPSREQKGYRRRQF